MLTIDIDRQYHQPHLPSDKDFSRWAANAYLDDVAADVALVIVDSKTMQTMNRDYRGKDSSTNVLSFPAELEPINGTKHLGDIIICAPVVESEASDQSKDILAHWAHMTIHGMLHLQGYDHIDSAEAEAMEALEIKLLADLQFLNPYQFANQGLPPRT